MADHVIADVAKEIGAQAVYATRSYEPWARDLENAVHNRLASKGVEFKRYAGPLLHEPDRLQTKAGDPFKVYTPFWRALRASLSVKRPLPAPSKLTAFKGRLASDALASWKLLPRAPDWASGFHDEWQPGEEGARERLHAFLHGPINDYASERDTPSHRGTSRLSPHLHFGELSPRQCWYAAEHARGKAGTSRGAEAFLKQLAWREFSYHQLFHWPDLADKPFRKEFAHFPWKKDQAAERAWQKGETGYPIVDAGMRELWSAGWMHNRVRMIVASFLIKDLLIPWQRGEAWFWDTLVDADLANNAASWQWVARLRRGRGPIFPHLQSHDAGREIRSLRRVCEPLGSGAGQAAGSCHPRALESRCEDAGERGCRPAARHTRTPSSITPSGARRRSRLSRKLRLDSPRVPEIPHPVAIIAATTRASRGPSPRSAGREGVQHMRYQGVVAAVIAMTCAFATAPAQADIRARISTSAQTMYVYVDGQLAYVWPVSTGRGRYATPGGTFRPQRLERRWYSTKYSGAPMHNAVFYNGGYAIHATSEVSRLGRPASHGCVRLAPGHARVFYALVREHGAGRTRISIGR